MEEYLSNCEKNYVYKDNLHYIALVLSIILLLFSIVKGIPQCAIISILMIVVSVPTRYYYKVLKKPEITINSKNLVITEFEKEEFEYIHASSKNIFKKIKEEKLVENAKKEFDENQTNKELNHWRTIQSKFTTEENRIKEAYSIRMGASLFTVIICGILCGFYILFAMQFYDTSRVENNTTTTTIITTQAKTTKTTTEATTTTTTTTTTTEIIPETISVEDSNIEVEEDLIETTTIYFDENYSYDEEDFKVVVKDDKIAKCEIVDKWGSTIELEIAGIKKGKTSIYIETNDGKYKSENIKVKVYKETTTEEETINYDNITVYVTPSGKCYHDAWCRYAKNGREISLKQAKKKYRACQKCNPSY